MMMVLVMMMMFMVMGNKLQSNNATKVVQVVELSVGLTCALASCGWGCWWVSCVGMACKAWHVLCCYFWQEVNMGWMVESEIQQSGMP